MSCRCNMLFRCQGLPLCFPWFPSHALVLEVVPCKGIHHACLSWRYNECRHEAIYAVVWVINLILIWSSSQKSFSFALTWSDMLRTEQYLSGNLAEDSDLARECISMYLLPASEFRKTIMVSRCTIMSTVSLIITLTLLLTSSRPLAIIKQ